MRPRIRCWQWFVAGIAICSVFVLAACGPSQTLPPAAMALPTPAPPYKVGPGDELEILVWRQPELSATVLVLPDGNISMPLIEDIPAVGKTPTELARTIEDELSQFVQDPLVTVVVTELVDAVSSQQNVRVVGEAATPQAIPYRVNMTALDTMIAAGGLTEFAAGNRATLVRTVNGEHKEFRVRLEDLVEDGDMSANVRILPGDVLVIPESYF